jgi:cyclic pyranopterin phosphate synthase
MIQDLHGRSVQYLRLSITDECDSRCIYCRPAGPRRSSLAQLSATEITALVRHLVQQHGVKKVRLTGGEPTTRPDLLEIVRSLASIDGLAELAMTTNGLTLAQQAAALKGAGLKRVNISLDTLSPEKYQRITGVDGLRRVLAGIDAALAAGLSPVKLNTVVVRGENEFDLPDLLLFAQWKRTPIRFIELMPMGPLAEKWQERFVPEEEIRQRLSDVVVSWTPRPDSHDPARKYYAGMTFGRGLHVGFITAMSCPFCSSCNRLRISADGSIYPCLMDKPAGNVLPALRPRFDPAALDLALTSAMATKPQEHPSTGCAIMTEIGG